jgi:hypothetical protein
MDKKGDADLPARNQPKKVFQRSWLKKAIYAAFTLGK